MHTHQHHHHHSHTGPDTFVYVNSILMLVMSTMFIKDLIMLYVIERRDRENDERIKTMTLIVQGVLGWSGVDQLAKSNFDFSTQNNLTPPFLGV